MRVGLCCAVVLLCLGCESKSAGSAPAVTPPDVANAELKRFLGGRLVTSKVRPPNETIWPMEPGYRQLDWLMPASKKGWGLETTEQLRAYVDVPVEKMNRTHAWFLGYMTDYPTALEVWRKLLREDPDDLEAAVKVATLAPSLKGPKAALEAIAQSSSKTAQNRDSRNAVFTPAQLEGLRCVLLLRTQRLEEARQACNIAYELDTSFGARTLAKVLLALGKYKDALVQAELVAKAPGRMNDSGALLTLGLVQQHNSLEKEARATWNVALARWPRDKLLNKAVSSPQRSVFDWEEDELALYRPALAEELALCGHNYSELGMQARAQECFRQSESVMEGPALAHQIVHLGETEPRKALELATAAIKRNPNVEQYRDVSKAWKEQAQRNGVGLAAHEPSSQSSAKPPRTEAVVIIPLGGRVAPELDGLSDFLSSRLPGLKVSIGAREDVPREAYKIAREQVIWEELVERLREEPGRLYVMEHDLSSYEGGFSYARFDLAHGRGVVSISRLRSLVGHPTYPETTLDGEVLTAAQNRLRSQVVGAVGKLLGVSFPCSSSSCAMRERRAVTDFVLDGSLLCEKHAKELNVVLNGRRPP